MTADRTLTTAGTVAVIGEHAQVRGYADQDYSAIIEAVEGLADRRL